MDENNDYDSPWKEALEVFFPQFMQLLFPKAFLEIDWNQDYEFLNTELQKIVRDAESGRGYIDKLVKVYTLDGVETWLLIHIEVQARADGRFNHRMYRYNYRLVDYYPEREIISLAILTNQLDCKHLGFYHVDRWGMSLDFKFPVVNLQNWRNSFAELEASNNPFSLVILAQLIAHNSQDNQQKYSAKFHLIRLLYKRGYQRQQVMELLRFIDWMLLLPKELEVQLHHEIIQMVEENKMTYVTTFERYGIEKGMQQGITKGEAQTLLKLFKLKFGSVPEWVEEKINTADKAQLDIWVERILTAETVEALFKEE